MLELLDLSCNASQDVGARSSFGLGYGLDRGLIICINRDLTSAAVSLCISLLGVVRCYGMIRNVFTWSILFVDDYLSEVSISVPELATNKSNKSNKSNSPKQQRTKHINAVTKLNRANLICLICLLPTLLCAESAYC